MDIIVSSITFLFTNIYFYLIGVPLCLATIVYFKQDMMLYVNYMPPNSIGKYIYLPSRFNLPFEDVFLITKDNVK